MNAVNYVIQHTYDFEHKVWSRAHQENIALVAMKVLGGMHRQNEFKLPEESYVKAIRYVLSLPGMACAVIGVKSVGELEKAAHTIATSRPLSIAELHDLADEGLKLAVTPDWQAAYGKPLT